MISLTKLAPCVILDANSSKSTTSNSLNMSTVTTVAQNALCTNQFFRPLIPVTVNVEGRRYCPVRTFPNEASVLHAILGNASKAVYFSHKARSLFATKLQNRMSDPIVKKALENVLKKYREIWNQETSNSDCETAKKRNANLLFGQKAEHSSAKAKEADSQFEKASAEIYLKNCKKRGYCFTDIDLELIAHVFKIQICVYSHADTFRHSFGSDYNEQIILIEETHGFAHDVYPCYQRCRPKTFAERAVDRFWYDGYTVPSIRLPMALYDVFSQHFPNIVRDIIFEYADNPFSNHINTAMQATLESEGWDKTIKSNENWNFVRQLHRNVTHITFDNESRDLRKKMKLVVCSSAFPNLKSIDFGKLTTVEDYQKVINQNTKIQALFFECISLADLKTLFESAPKVCRQLKGFGVRIIKASSAANANGAAPLSLVDMLKVSTDLQWISISRRYILSDELFRNIIENCPKMCHIDFDGGPVTVNLVIDFITKMSSGLQKLDLKVGATLRNCKDMSSESILGSLSIRNAIDSSHGNLMSVITSIPTLTELNISNIKLSSEEVSDLQNLSKSLRVLKMRSCCDHVIETVSKLTLLEELDIYGNKINACTIPQLGRLKNLRVLEWGGYCFKTTGSGSDYSRNIDDGETAEIQQALITAIPHYENIVTWKLYFIHRYDAPKHDSSIDKSWRVRP